MANAGYGVTCHDFKAMFSEPVDRVPRVVNGQASQRRISCVFVNPHTVSEVCVGAVSDTEALLEDGSRAGDLASRPKQRSAQGGALFDEQNARAALCGEQGAGNASCAAPYDDHVIVLSGICSQGLRSDY